MPPILPPQDGFLFLDKAKFAASFAADVEPEKAAFMADSQVPWGVDALSGDVTEPAWKTKPSWYLVATDDKMIPPPRSALMSKRAGSTVVEIAGQPRDLRVAAGSGRRNHREGCSTGRVPSPLGARNRLSSHLMKSFGGNAARRAARAHPGLAALGGRALPQPAPGPAGAARPERADADDQRIPLRRRAARAAAAAAVDESARGLDEAPASGLRATWLGHSTVLLEIDGVRVLTDPVWGTRASPLRLAGPKRFQPVPVPLARCRRSTWSIVSHDHYDHLDYPTIRALAETRRAVRDLARRRRAPRALGRAARAHHRARLVGVAPSCRTASSP